jgi:hypothetical protein
MSTCGPGSVQIPCKLQFVLTKQNAEPQLAVAVFTLHAASDAATAP